MNDHVTISTYELLRKYPNAETARLYPHCGFDQVTKRGGKRLGYYRCHRCKKEFTVRTGTIFERSHVPLDKWLMALYLVVTARKGISSLQLSKEIGVTQKTAWFILGRIREACGKDRKKLAGIIEIDEVYLGGLEKNKHKNKKLGVHATEGKTPVLGMRERGGRSKAVVVKETDKPTIQREILKHTEYKSTVYTDEHGAYTGLPNRFHGHVNHGKGEYVGPGNIHVNGTESMWALLRRSLHGTWHHVSVKHLEGYVDVATMRLNEGNVQIHTLDRLEALARRAFKHRITYKELTA